MGKLFPIVSDCIQYRDVTTLCHALIFVFFCLLMLSSVSVAVSSHSDTFPTIRATASLSPPRSTGVSPPSPAVSHQSTFKNALKHIPVPSPLIVDGIPVMRVYANGKTQKCYLTLKRR